MWKGVQEAQEHSEQNKAAGLGAVAGATWRAVSTESQHAALMRAQLVMAIWKRGILSEFETDGEPSDKVFRAAATFPMNKEDLGEAYLLAHLTTMPSEEAAKVKTQWLAEGYDAGHPKIDSNFLATVREVEDK